ncbi:MAG: ABC transporter permease [Rhizobiales bacterium]|nr:ABC transporter permease [Hyphomicrobiales bacterium]
MTRWLSSIRNSEALGSVAIFALLFATYFVLKGCRYSFFEAGNLATNVLPLVVVGLAQYFVVLVRGIDLSLGPIMAVSGSLAAVLFPLGIVPAIAIALAAGVLAGALNGLLIARLSLSPIVVTLATMSVWDGVALIVLPVPGGTIPAFLQAVLTSEPALLPMSLILLVGFALLGTWIMSTRFGLQLRAIGGDEIAAEASGVKVARIRFFAYVLAGFLAACAGLYFAISTMAGSPIIGDGYVLPSIGAVVLGGVPLIGGRGSPIGVVMGALILTIIGSLLYFADLADFYQSLINGVILIVVVGAAAVRDWAREALAR